MKPNRFILFAFLFTITLLSIANTGFSKKKRLPGGVFVDEPGDFLTNTTIMIDEYEVYPARKKRIKFGVNFEPLLLANTIVGTFDIANLFFEMHIWRFHISILSTKSYTSTDLDKEIIETDIGATWTNTWTNTVLFTKHEKKEGINSYPYLLWDQDYLFITSFSVTFDIINSRYFEFLVGLNYSTYSIKYSSEYPNSSLYEYGGYNIMTGEIYYDYGTAFGITLAPSLKIDIGIFTLLTRFYINIPVIHLDNHSISLPILITPIVSIGFEI